MKAISPVIATLILIAIAVIAGVFVLRQFILLSTTSAQQNMLQVQDLTFFRTISPDGSRINVTLQFSVKNVGQRRITLLNVTVPDANFTKETNVDLNPGQVYTYSYLVVNNTIYRDLWATGTEHLVYFYYHVYGDADTAIQVVSQKGVVQ